MGGGVRKPRSTGQVQARVLLALSLEPQSRSRIAINADMGENQLGNVLSKLCGRGLVAKRGYGMYSLAAGRDVDDALDEAFEVLHGPD